MGVVLNGANLYGYVRCKMGSHKKMSGAATNFLGQQVLGSVSIVSTSPAVAEKANHMALSGIAMQRADDGYNRSGNFGGSHIHNNVFAILHHRLWFKVWGI